MADRSTLDLDHHLTEIAESGFTVVDHVLGTDQVSDLRGAVEEAIEADWERYEGRPGNEHFIALDLIGHGGPFLDVIENPTVDRLFGSLLGEMWTLYTFTSTVVYPDTDQYTCAVHNDMARDSGDYMLGALATFALDDFTFENGTTWFLPGSHRRADKPSDDEFFDGAVRVEREAGSAAVFHPSIWHAGGQNTSGQARFGCTIYACRSFMRQRLDYPRLVEEAGLDIDSMTPTIRRVLGFDVRVPTSLDEFYVPTAERLYKPGQG
jgi:ectoine hydroxylase-related dioxygenase (phytanoyl-CoA dioxygenase family)